MCGNKENESIDDSSGQVSVLHTFSRAERMLLHSKNVTSKYAWFQPQTGYEWPNMQISTTISMQILTRVQPAFSHYPLQSIMKEDISCWRMYQLANKHFKGELFSLHLMHPKTIGSSPTCWIQFFIVQTTANTSLEPSQSNLQYKPQLLCAGNGTLESPQTKPYCNKRPNCCKLHCCVSGHKFKTNKSCSYKSINWVCLSL